jgi:hypothetical protein
MSEPEIRVFTFPWTSPELHPDLVGQRFENLLMSCIHFLGLEGAVLEAVGDGLAVGGDFPAGGVLEGVEVLEGNEQGRGEFEEDVFDLGVGQGGGEICCAASGRSGIRVLQDHITL